MEDGFNAYFYPVILEKIMTINKQQFAISEKKITHTELAAPINLITLTNCHGVNVTLSDLGASIWSVQVPSASNESDETVELILNYQDISQWRNNPYYFGVTAGRVANRIGGASFDLQGKTIKVQANEGINQLHGGPCGVSTRIWGYETTQDENSVAVVYRLTSKDGDQGFPGNIDIELEYRLNAQNELILNYRAKADQATPICLTNHAYWNLAGTSGNDILALELQLNADNILALDKAQIPTGELLAVKGGAFDFTQAKSVGKDIQQLDNGYDHFYVANRENDQSLMKIASLRDPSSGRVMEISTTELGVQFYSGNFLDGSIQGAQHKPLTKFMGLCLETHGYPNAVNHAHFPSIIVDKGKCYQQTTVHRFLNI